MKKKVLVLSLLVVMMLVMIPYASAFSKTEEISTVKDAVVKVNENIQTNDKYPRSPMDVDWWSMFHHDLTHSGYSTSSAPDTNNVLWSYTTGSDIGPSSPAIADGKVYIGSEDGKLYCLDATTGSLIWKYTTGWCVDSSPAVADGKVYVGSCDYKLYCLDAITGSLIWSYTTGSDIGPSSPAIADGKVYIGSEDGKLYCLDAITGSLIWKYTTGWLVDSSPAFSDSKVYVGSYDGKLYCLDSITGSLIWSYATNYWPVVSSPAIADGKVYVGSDDKKVHCLDATTGSLIWSYTTDFAVRSSPAVADGKVYVGSCDNKLYCLNAATGSLIWSYTTSYWIESSPAIADGKVYVGSDEAHKLYCLDATTGSLIWSYTTGSYVCSSPAIADGKVYVGSDDKKIYCFGYSSNQPPTVDIAYPVNGQTVSGTITITGTASDPDGTVTQVEVKIDDGDWNTASGTTSWSKSWDTTSVGNGQHTISARSKDNGSAYSNIDSVTVTVNNGGNMPPLVDITYPANGQTVSGTITITGTASDSDGSVTLVEVSIDSGSWQSCSGTTSWSKVWDTTGVGNGQHTISARSKDNSGAYSNIDSVTVNVDNGGGDHADKPVWDVGQSWTYSISNLDVGSEFSADPFNLAVEVSEKTSSTYTLTFSGSMTGSVTLTVGGIDFTGSFSGDFSGWCTLDNNDIGLKEIQFSITGTIDRGPGHAIRYISIDATMDMKPDNVYNFFNFPIYDNEIWTIPTENFIFSQTIKYKYGPNWHTYTPSDQNIPLNEHNAQCVGIEYVGDLQTYHVQGNGEYWYCPSKENVAKFDGTFCNIDCSGQIEDCAPYIPTINGPTSGNPGTPYSYTFSTTDPDGDNVYYYVDWGDGTNTNWLGPYASGAQESATHSWSQKGTYAVKVKAKDIHGDESDWGTLQVTMPLDLTQSQSQSIPSQQSPPGSQSSPQVNPSPNQQQINQQIITRLFQNLILRHQVLNLILR